ncbi:MAG: hypothetical protein Q4E91_06495, partial [Lachnospiraceae bacterium]|nr:hypothetical protein [Lachnospiraceae bacterium]
EATEATEATEHPESRETPAGSGDGQGTGVRTGDETDMVSWIVIMLLSLSILIAMGITRQRNAKQR